MFFSATSKTEHSAVVTALSASQAVIEFTPNGEILMANDNFLKTMGYGLKEITGKHHRIFCDHDYADSEDYRQFWHDLGQGQFKSNEFKRFNKAGDTIWLQASYNPIFDRAGKVVKIIKFAADITAVKTQNMDHKGKIDAISRAQAIIEFSPKGEILTANNNFLKAMGYTLHEVAGQHHRMFCEPEYVQSEAYRRFWEDLAKGEFQAAEYKRIGKGGREVYIQASYNPIFDDTGAVVKVVKFATDLTETVLRRLRNDRLGQDINTNLGGVITEINQATQMASGVSEASTETSAIINSVAAASEELSQSVRDISQSMGYARDSVEGIFKHADAANSSVTTLNTTATSMNSVVTLIQDIAAQINLLALNATIESARAGEAGRGFAVVASEVKSLANQAARATQTIATEISSMQAITTEVVEALSLISGSITSVLENVGSVASAIEQQNAVTSEITHNMQAAVGAVTTIEDNLGHINETFNNVASASEQVKKSVESLVA